MAGGSHARFVRVGMRWPLVAAGALFKIFCCAGDAVLMKVRVRGAPAEVEKGTWVEATGRYVPGDVYPPVLAIDEMRSVEQPEDPYLYL